MFKYSVWYKDEVFGELCKAEGRVRASNMNDAKIKLKEFYPNISYLNITPLIIEDNFCLGEEEWDII